jgi:outer membrane lipoprotein-sorting protein
MFPLLSNTLKRSKLKLFGALIIAFCISFSYETNPGISILEEVFETNHTLKGVKLTMLIKERIDGEFLNKKTDFKISYSPYKLYLKQHYPYEGLEILYVHGENNDKAFLNRNARAMSNFTLDPLGNRMRNNNHHSIFRAGYSYYLEVVESLYNTYDKSNKNIWQYKGLVKYNNIICHKVVFHNDNFRYVPYKVRNGETLESISKKLLVCDYLILEKNPEIKSFDYLKPGTTIMVPSDYAKQIVMYIDAERIFPIGLKNYDEKGLFQQYTYLHFELNPKFSDQDFSYENPKYGFKKTIF